MATPQDQQPPDDQRGGPRAPWFVVLLVVATGAGLMGWTIYELVRAAGG